MTNRERLTIKMWGETRQLQAELCARLIMRDRREYTLTDVFEAEVERVYRAFKQGGFKLPIIPSDGSRFQGTQHVSQECYEQLLGIQAYAMMQEKSSVPLTRVIHSVIVHGLSRVK